MDWGAQAARDPVMVSNQLRELLGWYAEGKLKPLVAATYPLADAATAMEALQSRRYPGKIVLVS